MVKPEEFNSILGLVASSFWFLIAFLLRTPAGDCWVMLDRIPCANLLGMASGGCVWMVLGDLAAQTVLGHQVWGRVGECSLCRQAGLSATACKVTSSGKHCSELCSCATLSHQDLKPEQC